MSFKKRAFCTPKSGLLAVNRKHIRSRKNQSIGNSKRYAITDSRSLWCGRFGSVEGPSSPVSLGGKFLLLKRISLRDYRKQRYCHALAKLRKDYFRKNNIQIYYMNRTQTFVDPGRAASRRQLIRAFNGVKPPKTAGGVPSTKTSRKRITL